MSRGCCCFENRIPSPCRSHKQMFVVLGLLCPPVSWLKQMSTCCFIVGLYEPLILWLVLALIENIRQALCAFMFEFVCSCLSCCLYVSVCSDSQSCYLSVSCDILFNSCLLAPYETDTRQLSAPSFTSTKFLPGTAVWNFYRLHPLILSVYRAGQNNRNSLLLTMLCNIVTSQSAVLNWLSQCQQKGCRIVGCSCYFIHPTYGHSSWLCEKSPA